MKVVVEMINGPFYFKKEEDEGEERDSIQKDYNGLAVIKMNAMLLIYSKNLFSNALVSMVRHIEDYSPKLKEYC